MSEEEYDFEEQIRLEKEERKKAAEAKTRVDEDGTEYEWDESKKAWFPKIDANFIAQYQMNYGNFEGDQSKEGNSETQNSQGTTSSIPPAPPIDDPGYYYWYYHLYLPHEQQSSKPTTSETDKENSTTEKSENEQPSEGEKEKDSQAYNDYYKKYYEYYYSQHKSEGGEDNGSKDSSEYDDYWSQYYNYNHQYCGSSDNKESSEEMKDQGESEEKDGEQKEGDAKTSKGKKRKDEPQKDQGWFEMDQSRNTSVYVSKLPHDITDEEYKELMTKCGLISMDPATNTLKLKLYRDREGNVKGDGLCSYIKMESVDLALDIIDGCRLRDCTISVEAAQFELKGAYDPAKKKKKLTNKQKRKLKERQEKLFDWKLEKGRGVRSNFEKTVVFKNVFDPKEFDKDPGQVFKLRDKLKEECANYGDVRKVVIYDRHAEMVATAIFREVEEADMCREYMDNRYFNQRTIKVDTWDGKTKYNVQETEEETEARLQSWGNYLEGDTPVPSTTTPLAASTSSKEQAVSKEPAAVDKPVSLKEPTALKEPTTLQEPISSKESIILHEPTEEPTSSDNLTSLKEPAAGDEPVSLKEPAAGDEPISLKDPAARDEPISLKEPAVGDEPISLKEPAAGDEPVSLKDPAARDEPISLKEPAVGDEPVSLKEPAAVNEPVSLKEPAAGDEPVSLKEPAPLDSHSEPVLPSQDDIAMETDETVSQNSPKSETQATNVLSDNTNG